MRFVIVPIALAALVASCAPHVGPRTMESVVVYESGANPNAIGDDTTHRAYFPTTRDTAAALAISLLRAGHDLDLGYAQINASNLARTGLDARTVFEPCANLAVASRILRDDYARAVRRFGPGQTALRHALSAYNSGGYRAGLAYANGVYATAFDLFARPATDRIR